MKKIILLCLIFAGSFSFAAIQSPKTYNLKMELSINGKMVSAPIISVIEGEKALITQKGEGAEENYIEVTAKREISKTGKADIFMDLQVGYINADGSRKVVSSPKLYVAENKRAEIVVGKDDQEAVTLSVIVNEKKM